MAIRTSTEVKDLMALLVTAQSKSGAAIKDTKNPLYGSMYADISSVLNATLEHLNAAGILLMQHPALDWKQEGETMVAYVTVTTRLQHGEQWIESDLTVPAIQRGKFDAQSVGTGITYACRYALQAILAIPREDDDGNAASGRGTSDAAQAVGKAKVEALRASKAQEQAPQATDALFYLWNNDNQTAEINGPDVLLKLHKPYLKQFWNPTSRSLVVNADQLEAMKYEMEQRKVQFLPLKPR